MIIAETQQWANSPAAVGGRVEVQALSEEVDEPLGEHLPLADEADHQLGLLVGDLRGQCRSLRQTDDRGVVARRRPCPAERVEQRLVGRAGEDRLLQLGEVAAQFGEEPVVLAAGK